MERRTLNLGILAHVDAGKTTLTERLLYAAGSIDRVGSVDAGTTQTDTLALERERGITIRSAVAAFEHAGTTVNLIDTPGHPDFIAEVERVLGVLDGAVLVLSAVEGVQPQTKVLMRALQRLQVPTVLFVNKTDRMGADVDGVLTAVRERLTPYAVSVMDRDAALDVLTERDDSLLAEYVADEGLTAPRIQRALVEQTRAARVCPVLSGSAKTGVGTDELMDAVIDLLTPSPADECGAPAGRVFKIERDEAGRRVAFVRMFRGCLRVRDRDPSGTVQGLSVLRGGRWTRADEVRGGEIARLTGLHRIRVGDAVGAGAQATQHHFPPPTLEAVVAARRPEQGHALEVALGQLADQDPLIDVRHDAAGRLAVSLYGRVQQEVIAATLAREFGIDAEFEDATVVHVERPRHRGEAIEVVNTESNPYHATVGLRIEPGEAGSGLVFRTDVPAEDVPLYLYKSIGAFAEVMERHVRRTLAVGLHGWRVTDVVVTLTDVAYTVADGPPSRRGPRTTAVDYRKLTPTVLRQALRRADTVVCEPVLRVFLEVPTAAAGVLHRELGRIGARTDDQTTTQSATQSFISLEVLMPAARFHELQRQLPDLTGGEGVAEPRFEGYQRVRSTRALNRSRN